jgi:hypothetical protein
MNITARVTTIAVVFVSLAAHAEDCAPKFIAEAEFGPRELVTRTNCLNIPAAEEQSCTFEDGGVSYGVSAGLIIHKVAVAETYSGKLPFGLAWGENLEAATHKIEAITGGKPAFGVDRRDETAVLNTEGYCLRTLGGAEYDLELWLDRGRGLYKIEGRILYP